MGQLVQSYLSLYNLSLAVGWSYCMYLTVLSKKDFPGMWSKVEIPLKIVQTAAILEILHAALGIVKSSVTITFGQVFSRVGIVWGALDPSLLAQTSIGVPALLLAWNTTEIIRYAYYFLNQFGIGFPLQWLRYSLFIVLYPLGLYGELSCIYAAWNDTKRTDPWNLTMLCPESLTSIFNYENLAIASALMYIPLFPIWYFHMFTQRRKMLRDGVSKMNKKKSN